MSWQQRYVERFYESRPGWVDGTAEFHSVCRGFIPAGAAILEIGAGSSNPTSRFLASLGPLHGVDLDPAVRHNDALKEARIFDGTKLPYEEASIDACVSNWVVEHLPDPARHLAEIRRVLKPGGVYSFRTSNAWHYVGGVARLTSHRFHVAVANRLRNLPTGTHDPYPTCYRMNSRRKILQLMRGCGFSVETLSMIEKEPFYGLSSRALFLTFLAYEVLVNSTELLAPFRSAIICVVRKPAA